MKRRGSTEACSLSHLSSLLSTHSIISFSCVCAHVCVSVWTAGRREMKKQDRRWATRVWKVYNYFGLAGKNFEDVVSCFPPFSPLAPILWPSQSQDVVSMFSNAITIIVYFLCQYKKLEENILINQIKWYICCLEQWSQALSYETSEGKDRKRYKQGWRGCVSVRWQGHSSGTCGLNGSEPSAARLHVQSPRVPLRIKSGQFSLSFLTRPTFCAWQKHGLVPTVPVEGDPWRISWVAVLRSTAGAVYTGILSSKQQSKRRMAVSRKKGSCSCTQDHPVGFLLALKTPDALNSEASGPAGIDCPLWKPDQGGLWEKSSVQT